MDEPEIVISNTPEKNGFFSYVFNFDTENKNAIFNMLQYGALSIIPVILTLRLIKSIIPEDDETKGSLEITFEVIAQLSVLILAVWYTNKIIRYIPTYTGSPYSSFSETSAIIPFVIILITMQTKLGAKVNLLVDRVTEYIRGSTGVEAPPQQQQQQQQHISTPDNLPRYQPNNHPQQSDGYDVLKLLPSNKQLTAMPEHISNMSNSTGNSRNQTTVTTALNEPTASNEGGGGWSAW
uniref:Uncharacterized protein n=1 Tax=viral metagenome TaxID=1070528 RepID=A0A6C0HNR9_9ZZZZ